MSQVNLVAAPPPPTQLDYSLVGFNAARAVERGLAEADWYQCPVPREAMRKLLEPPKTETLPMHRRQSP